MEIFIGNLPHDTSAVDLRRLLGDAGFQARYRIYRKTLQDGTVKCYGEAVVEPDSVAHELIGRLNNSVVQENCLEVRPYYQRSHTNDRRGPLWSGVPWAGLDRRKADRRGRR